MRAVILLVIIHFLLVQIGTCGDKGSPVITNFLPKDHQMHEQNWCIVQDHDGFLFFANQSGLLMNSGTEWVRVPITPVLSTPSIYSLAVSNKGSIMIGGNGQIGEVRRNDTGNWEVINHTPSIPKEMQNFFEVWNTIQVEDATYFCARNAIFKLAKNQIKIIRPLSDKGFHKLFYHEGKLIVREIGIGLCEIQNDTPKLLPGGEFFNEIRVDMIMPQENKWLIGTRNEGLFYYHPTSQKLPVSCETPSSDIFKGSGLYHGIKLSNNKIAVATTNKGIYICSANGSIEENYTRETGLSTDKIWFLYEDHQSNLWAATDKSITRIDYLFPLRWFGQRQGINGNINSVTGTLDGEIWAVGTEGIYYGNNKLGSIAFKNYNPEYSFVSLVVFAVETENKHRGVLTSNLQGLMFISSKMEEIWLDEEHIYFAFSQSEIDENIILASGKGCVSVIQMIKGVPKVIDTHEFDTNDEFKFPVSLKDGRFIVSGNGDNLLEISINYSNVSAKPNYKLIKTIRNKQLVERPILRVGDLMLIASGSGLSELVLEDGNAMFRPCNLFDQRLQEKGRALFRISCDRYNNIWLAGDDPEGEKESGLAMKTKEGIYKFESKPFKKLNTTQVNGFWHGNDGITWIATNSGLVKYDPFVNATYNHPVKTWVSDLTFASDRLLKLIHEAKIEEGISFNSNKVDFKISAPSFFSKEDMHFSSYLEGLEPGYGNWVKSNIVQYNYLPEGTYTIHARTKDIYENISKEAIITFTILPPWYRTGWAYLFYFLAGIVLIYAVVKYNTLRLKRINELLDLTVKIRTKELSEEKAKVELANREITDSINYARVIQDSILPDYDSIRKVFPNSFIYYRPRNIVSGDFYWCSHLLDVEKNEEAFLFALVDCTGHGVPGAFMSMIGSEKLNLAVRGTSSCDPSRILKFMNREIRKTLRQNEEHSQSQDGMEVGLISYYPRTRELLFAGANRPLWIFKPGEEEPHIVKPTKAGLGGGTLDDTEFAGHTIQLEKGDRIFLFSDGATDQFGGEQGKKLTSKGLRTLFITTNNRPFFVQESEVISFFTKWGVDVEQVDDILIAGFEI